MGVEAAKAARAPWRDKPDAHRSNTERVHTLPISISITAANMITASSSRFRHS